MGIVASHLGQTFPPASKFKAEDIPDLSGWVILVTGGNTGIGYEIIKVLLLKNAKVYMATRSKEKAELAIANLKAETGGKEAIFLELDLSNLSSVRNAAEEFKQKESALHVLFNNGGVMYSPIELVTADGYDMQFGTNVIGHYVLFKRLVSTLIAGAQTSSDHKARIVHISSFAMMLTNKIHYDVLRDVPQRRTWWSVQLYNQSKLANVIFSNEIARRYGSEGLVSTSVNPGNVKSEITRSTPASLMYLFGWLLFITSKTYLGALTPLYAGVSAGSGDFNGKYFIPWAREGKMRLEARDPTEGERLWQWLESETKE